MERLIASLLLSIGCFSLPAPSRAESVTYEKHIRPILKAHCYPCHGEAGVRKGGLDLRLRRFALRGGESGPAITPGDPKSLLIERLRNGEMPPKENKVPSHEIDLIETWIQQGAKTLREEPETLGNETLLTPEDLAFWAFQPVKRVALPQVRASETTNTPIDHFILRQLEDRGLTFSQEATKETLIRRVYFDFLGLPPTPDAVEFFLTDTSPDAYPRLVERLLASPHYGERWGRHWLDVVGYADSEGFTDSDPVRPNAFLFRDYVVRAFNNDKPFDRFIVEQLAGDELAPRPFKNLRGQQIELLTATGFLRMVPDGTASNGVDVAIASNEVVADTLRVVSTSLLGLTVGCARCHDHRYDPVSQVDYYRLRAIFEPALDWKKWKRPKDRRISLYDDEDREAAATIEAKAKVVDQEREASIRRHIDRTLEEELLVVPDEVRERLRVAYRTAKAKRDSVQTELLEEYPSVGNISRGSLYLYSEQRQRRAGGIDNAAKKREAEYVRLANLQSPTTSTTGAPVAAPPVTAATLAKVNPQAAAEVAAYRQAAQTLRATDSNAELAKLAKRARAIRATIPQEGFIRALAEPTSHTPKTFLFRRGHHEQAADWVPPGELAVLNHKVPVKIATNDDSRETSGRRLAYARHLTNERHPLTARVIVNRIWLHHFGRGIVNSPGDFGQLGERPSHPQLLDWLADEFVQSGWQIKSLHRMILNSATYRQSSTRTAELDQVDPENRLYARMTLRRLESEAIRDAVLSVSGHLNAKMYGPAIPVKEDAVGQIVLGKENLDGERKPSAEIPLEGEDLRRSLYVQVRRSKPLAVLETFDLPTVTPNCTQRSYSNVAPQSLLLMNSQFIVKYAKTFADHLIHEHQGRLRAQLSRAWELAYGVTPSESAVSQLSSFVAAQQQIFAGQDKKLGDTEARRLALSSACQALLSSNRFLYVD